MLSNICTLRHLLLGKDFVSSNLTSPVFGYIPAICPEPLDVELALAFHWVSMWRSRNPRKRNHRVVSTAEPPRHRYSSVPTWNVPSAIRLPSHAVMVVVAGDSMKHLVLTTIAAVLLGGVGNQRNKLL